MVTVPHNYFAITQALVCLLSLPYTEHSFAFGFINIVELI